MILNIDTRNRVVFLRRNNIPSLMDMFKPLHIILSLLGLFPYMIKYPTSEDPRVEKKTIIFNAICAFIMTLVLCTFFGLNLVYYLHITEKIVSMIHINYIIEVLTLISSGIIAYISTFKNRKVYIKILDTISTTWNDLGLLEAKEITKYFKIHVMFLIFGWLSMLVIPYVIVFLVLDNTQKMFKQKVYTIVPEIVVTSVVGFYYVLMLMVACLLKNINQQIQNLDEERENENLNTLGRLEVAYTKTLEAERDINRIFEVPIAIMLVQGFHTTLRQAHGLYYALYHMRNFGSYGMIMATFFILYPLSKMFAMTYTGTMLKDLTIQVGQSLHDIPIREDDTKLYLEIQHFSKLMYYYDTEINIFGFCSLDSNLWFNMIASAVTYFVILVQFDL